MSTTCSEQLETEASNEEDKDEGKREEDNNDQKDKASSVGNHADLVAEHYNNIEDKGVQGRFESPIFHMRNFNNWVKSVLISTFIEKLRGQDYSRPVFALDMCCGKGGDLLKWQNARIKHLVCADIASVSVQQCRDRYTYTRGPRCFTAEFITADCTKDRLREKYSDPSIRFDIVSCQFGFHYCFESLPQAECMLRNISECLRAGGYFVGTLPDAHEIISRCKRAGARTTGNKLYNIKLLFDEETYPLFGAKYDFQLAGVVDCPEFLVYFPVMTKLAAKFGLQLVLYEKFDKFFDNNRTSHSDLLSRIKVFESYRPEVTSSQKDARTEYEHAETYLASSRNTSAPSVITTMSKSEWEAATIYSVFAFKKCKSTLDGNGKPVYEMSSEGGKRHTSPQQS